MQIGKLVVGLIPVAVPITAIVGLADGLRLLQRSADSGKVYIGATSSITANGTDANLLPKGDWGTTEPYTVPKEHFVPEGKLVYLVADTAAQNVDWSAQ